jgi:hypothetical protein
VSFWPTILPVITLILGYFGTLLTESKRDARAVTRTREERDAVATQKRREWRETFELETLRRAHTSLSDLARAAMRHHLADMREAQSTGTYGKALVGDELSQTLLAANRAVHEVLGLILDDDIRASVQRAHEAVNLAARHRGSPNDAENLIHLGSSQVGIAQQAIAERVREIYKGSVTTP